MRYTLFLFLVALSSTSCATNDNLKNNKLTIILTQGNERLEGVTIERFYKKKFFTRLFNPVGSFYHPRSIEAVQTNANGVATFESFNENDYFLIRSVPPVDLLITINEREHTSKISAEHNDQNLDHSFFFNTVNDIIEIRYSPGGGTQDEEQEVDRVSP